MLKISPSILNVQLDNIENEVQLLDKAGADYIHIDIMDGKFVNNTSFDLETVRKIRALTSRILDVHLMVQPVKSYIFDFIDVGSDIITFHPEADKNPSEIIEIIKKANKKVGLAIQPQIQIKDIEIYLPEVQQIIVMAVVPGFGGQKFMQDQVIKVNELFKIRQNFNYDYKISVDGGINNVTGRICKDNGADVLAVGSYLLSHDSKDYKKIINLLR
tara:strand:+ start:2577 stop:3224 length:648 start_codon:yes stop_codon:yes gene_type:complete